VKLHPAELRVQTPLEQPEFELQLRPVSAQTRLLLHVPPSEASPSSTINPELPLEL